jgi:YegS/Rv2252/BmrU family lipid kinase
MEKVGLILNPNAGAGSKQGLRARIEKALSRRNGYDLEVCVIAGAGDAHAFAARLEQSGYGKIIAAGGDGTVSGAASALLHTNAALGILPCGSGNGLARHIGMPMNIGKALDYLRSAHAVSMDVGMVNGKPFLCTCGVGFDALIGMKFAAQKRRGLLTYLRLILQEIGSYRCHNYQLCLDGNRVDTQAFLITFANASQWGNNGWIAPSADICDGLIDVVIVRTFAMYKLPLLLGRLLTKGIGQCHEVQTIQCHHATLLQTHSPCAHYDGEPACMGASIEVNVSRHALNILRHGAIKK